MRIAYGAGLAALLAAGIGYLLPSRIHDGSSQWFVTLTRAKQLWLGLEVYSRDSGSYPQEDDAGIMRELCGENPKNAQLFSFVSKSTHRATNRLGQCVDAWDTPFQVDFSPTNAPVVRSAGINRVFGDEDDLAFNGTAITFVKP